MKKLLLTVLISLPFLASAQTSFVATFSFDSVKTTTGDVDPTPHPVVTGLSFDSVRAVGVSANPTATGRFSFQNWPAGAPGGNLPYSSFTGTVDTGKYIQVGIIPQTGYMVDIDSIAFRFQRSGTGVRTYVVRGSEDGFTNNLTAGISPANPKLSVESGNVFFMTIDSSTGQNGSKIYLDTTYGAETDAVYFRFYGYNAEGNLGTFSLDNLTIYGSVSILSGLKMNITSSILVYPNPAQDAIRVVSSAETKEISIFDIAGNLVLKTRTSESNLSISVQELPSGVYFVNVSTNANTSTTRFIKN